MPRAPRTSRTVNPGPWRVVLSRSTPRDPSRSPCRWGGAARPRGASSMKVLLVKEYGDTIAAEIANALPGFASINYTGLYSDEFEKQCNNISEYDVVTSCG